LGASHRSTGEQQQPGDLTHEDGRTLQAGALAPRVKRQFGYQKVRFKGLPKNTAQVLTLFALSNLWMARRTLLTAAR
jgi:IS5 family transposase